MSSEPPVALAAEQQQVDARGLELRAGMEPAGSEAPAQNFSAARRQSGLSAPGSAATRISTPRTAAVDAGSREGPLLAVPSSPGGGLPSSPKRSPRNNDPPLLQRPLRRLVYEFLIDSDKAPSCFRWSSILYHTTAGLVIIGLIIVDTATANQENSRLYRIIQLVATVLWCLEHVVRIWACVEGFPENSMWPRMRYFFKPSTLLETFVLGCMVVDLIIVEDTFRGISMLRVLRVLTLYRVERDFQIFRPVVRVIVETRAELGAAMVMGLLTLVLASVIMFYIEVETKDSQFTSVAASMWWGVATLTTVGYGDMVPATTLGRCVAGLVAFIGTGMFGLFAGILADGFREVLKDEKSMNGGGSPSSSGLALGAGSDSPRGNSPLGGATEVASSLRLLEARVAQQEELVKARFDGLQKDVDEALSLLRQLSSANSGQSG